MPDAVGTWSYVTRSEGEYHLYYFDINGPAEHELKLPAGGRYRADIIDPWAMTKCAGCRER